MNLEFLVGAIKHNYRIYLVLKQARGYSLLVRIYGSGRKNYSMLASVNLEFTLKSIDITKNFKMEDY